MQSYETFLHKRADLFNEGVSRLAPQIYSISFDFPPLQMRGANWKTAAHRVNNHIIVYCVYVCDACVSYNTIYIYNIVYIM